MLIKIHLEVEVGISESSRTINKHRVEGDK